MQFIGSVVQAPAVQSAPVAVKPLFWKPEDHELVIAAGTGDTAGDVFDGTSGLPAPYGGTISKSDACDAVKLVVTYLVGDDFNPCTVDTLTTSTEEFTIPKGVYGIRLDHGYISSVTAVVVDSAGVETTSAAGNTISFSSERAGAQGGGVIIP